MKDSAHAGILTPEKNRLLWASIAMKPTCGVDLCLECGLCMFCVVSEDCKVSANGLHRMSEVEL